MCDFIDSEGNFLVHRHDPCYRVRNLRVHDRLACLGLPEEASAEIDDDQAIDNRRNFPAGDLAVEQAEPVYEIPNPFPFRGVTYICRTWAEQKAAAPESIQLPPPPETSLAALLDLVDPDHSDRAGQDPAAPSRPAAPRGASQQLARQQLIDRLPRPLKLTLAATATDPADLTALAACSCELLFGPEQIPTGLRYRADNGAPLIHDHDLFETVANNPHLPDRYKEVMVLRPGTQGGSEIVGEYGGPGEATHIYEYLRRNSYIPWGHYAANLAEDAVRYRISELTGADITGLRHLYYQRTFVRLAELLGLPVPRQRRTLPAAELEELRLAILAKLETTPPGQLPFTATLWGWNFGYDCSGSGFRLHASHQQVHQQYALIPPPPAFACGDQVASCGRNFRQRHDRGLFAAYRQALAGNRRVDGRDDRPASLIVHEDKQMLLFVPKAQVSQWELQIMTKEPVGNILEADIACRTSLDRALLLAQRILSRLGATLVTSIEYSKRLDNPDPDQRLLYALLPKLPYAMGAFTEAQQRFICGHYPEDFAARCRDVAAKLPGV